MRILLSVVLLFLFIPPWTDTPRLPLFSGSSVALTVTPVPLDADRPDRRSLGGLTYLGGVAISAKDPGFGGYSAMLVNGTRFTLLSDGGNLLHFDMGGDFQPRNVAVGALPNGPGRGWHRRDRDSESLTRDPETGQLWVGFEFANAIWRYTPDFKLAQGHVAPAVMADWPENGGAESMVRLRDGRFIVISEGEPGVVKGTREALVFDRDPLNPSAQVFKFSYRAPSGFRATDVVELPDGRLAVLNRRFNFSSFFSAALTVIDVAKIKPGAVVTGKEIARFEDPIIRDNLEALAVTQEGRDTILWIASDDNQWSLQRTILLKFRLDP